ncbi:MurR/RpiR family transcriptional regulator [Anaerococcus sp. AGMB00486]|uniref:MurR/RpiR family transcriptional regulator n=2 Tax=Anaerococcus TaxID=165779 RepID=A0ABX2N9L6_9FIRM|nr:MULTISPECIES: MurR/RpiR family transcriptional regulator [Anaerococcus]MSS78288.1 MurR/RpiR family transcriptional regulator [Anaerococcus porci]NVF11402.1 MurR/RpiR family transcriptional regulator [Anaerococcus faecalis]
MKVSDLVKESYENLDSKDIELFSYITQNKDDFVEKNLKDFSKNTKFSTSSIVNLAKKLGLDGYSELKYLIKWEDGKIVDFDENEIEFTYNDILISMNMIKNRNLDFLFENLDKAENIYVIYSGFIQRNLAQELKRNFLNIGKIIIIIDARRDIALINENIKEKDIIFALSFSGDNKLVINFLNNIKKKVFVVSITKLSNNKLSKISDVNLNFISHEVYRYEKNTSISPVSQYYVIIDFLVLKYINYKSKKNTS